MKNQAKLNFGETDMIEETVIDGDIFGSQDIDIDGDIFEDGAGAHDMFGDSADSYKSEPQQPQTTINIGQAVKAEFAINLIDTATPPLLKILLGYLGYTGVKTTALKMSASEKKFLEQPTQDYLNTIDIKMTPLQGFFTAIASVYATKVVAIVTEGKPDKQEQETDAPDLNVNNQPQRRTRAKRSDAGKKRTASA